MCNCDKRTNCGSDEKVAIHEAGHALMFDALGIPLSFVTIDEGCQGEEPSFEGCVKLGSDTNNVCDVIAGTMAGPAASFFIANEPADREATLKFRSDQTILRKIHQAETEAESYDEFWARLQVFLGVWLRDWMWNHRDAIQRFAADLSLERTLSGQELARSLTAAWAGLKPDAIALHGEVASTLNQLLNTNPSSPSSNTEIIGIERSMVAYRLVNQEHDPIEVGSVLSRTSDHSHQKIADGIYFAITREDALEFSRTDHGHAYTHLLTCRIKDLSKGDLVDLTADESLFVRLKPPANSPLFGLKGRALHTKYCEIHRKKGILWRARRRWTELCLLKAFAKDSVIIEAVDALGR